MGAALRALLSSAAVARAFYDAQCEVCQAFAAWLRVLDRRGRVECVPISDDAVRAHGLDLAACLRQLHVVAPDGRVRVGWDAVAYLARRCPATWPIGALGAVPPLSWLARRLYGYVATNRFALSKCRGGACRVARPAAVRRQAPLHAFWTCYSLGMLVRAPIVVGAEVAGLAGNAVAFARTFRRRVDLLDGRLSLLFLGGVPCDVVPLVFGERFAAVLYDGVLIDPGSPRMRRSLSRHLRRLPTGTVKTIAATHHHEEHVGNLGWAAEATGVPIALNEMTEALVRPGHRLPAVRRVMIGQPEALERPVKTLGSELASASGRLIVLPSPGHCADHVVLYDPERRVLLAGDAFMGTYFATPNADVDSVRWLETLERLLDLEVEILVEGHGHVRTLRRDIPDIPGVVIREDPRVALRDKLQFMRWVREQVTSGFDEQLPLRAIEATCFPWGRGRGWETFLNDEIARLVSLGDFSRTELVRSFVRAPGDGPLPTVFEVRGYNTSL